MCDVDTALKLGSVLYVFKKKNRRVSETRDLSVRTNSKRAYLNL